MCLQLLQVLGLTKYFKISDWIELDTSASVEDFSVYKWKNFEKVFLWADRTKLIQISFHTYCKNYGFIYLENQSSETNLFYLELCYLHWLIS